MRVARGLDTGTISINSHSSVRVTTPFGGFKQSGVGRELGPTRWITTPSSRTSTCRPPDVRAVQVTRFGGPEVLGLAEVEKPAPISTEVLVRVMAAGVNPVDCKTRRGEGVARWMGPPPFLVGWDVCGTVEAMGYGVTRFQVGDIVYGMPRFPRSAGGYAEYVTAPSRQFAHLPKGISPIEAAALPLAALTAWQCLVDSAQIKTGETVLVHGAAGGVGHLAVQIAESRGARVIAGHHRGNRDALAARDVDVALDLVGGSDTQALLATVERVASCSRSPRARTRGSRRRRFGAAFASSSPWWSPTVADWRGYRASSSRAA